MMKYFAIFHPSQCTSLHDTPKAYKTSMRYIYRAKTCMKFRPARNSGFDPRNNALNAHTLVGVALHLKRSSTNSHMDNTLFLTNP